MSISLGQSDWLSNQTNHCHLSDYTLASHRVPTEFHQANCFFHRFTSHCLPKMRYWRSLTSTGSECERKNTYQFDRMCDKENSSQLIILNEAVVIVKKGQKWMEQFAIINTTNLHHRVFIIIRIFVRLLFFLRFRLHLHAHRNKGVKTDR